MFKAGAPAAVALLAKLKTATEEFKKRWDINLDKSEMTMTADVEGKALEGSANQLVTYCDEAMATLKKLP